MNDRVREAKRFVVKVGSSLVTNGGEGLDLTAMGNWAHQIARLRTTGSTGIATGFGSNGWGSSGLAAAGRAARLLRSAPSTKPSTSRSAVPALAMTQPAQGAADG